MPICSLDHCCVSRVYAIHFLHHVVHSSYSEVDREVVDRGVADRGVADRGVVDRGVLYRGM